MEKMITKTALLFVLSVFFAISIKAQIVSGVSLSGKDTITLGVDSTAILAAIISPPNATNKSVVWTTTDKLIVDTVSVVEDTICEIKGTGVGEAKIIVQTKEGNFRDTCVVNVVIPVDSVTLENDSLTMILGHDTALISKIYPPAPTNGEMIWTNSDPSVIEIVSVTDDSICSIKALKLGVATLFVTSSFDGLKKDSCVVTVKALPVENLTLSHDSIKYMRLGSDTALIARVVPFGETNDSVIWTSDDHTVVEVTSSGYDTVCTVGAKGIGTTYIYAVSLVDRDKKDSCFVSVVGVPVEGISLLVDSLDLKVHNDTALIARITPFDATNDSIRWTSSDSTIIDIITAQPLKNDTVCTVIANKSGGAYIYAQTFEGGYKDSCFVSVIVPVDSVVLNSSAVGMNLKNDTVCVLKAKVYPDSATFKSPLRWVNKNESIARIDSVKNDTLCYMKALAPGLDTLYAVTDDGVESRYCFITVGPRLADSVRIAKNGDLMVNDTLLLGVNGSIALQTAIYPSNVTNDTVKLTGSNSEILRIDSLPEGVYIHALREGTATVYAVAADESREKDSCIVKVVSVPSTGIRLNKDTLRMYEENVDSLIATVLPLNATDKTVIWRLTDVNGGNINVGEFIDIISSSADNDSVYKFKALKADTLIIFAFAEDVDRGLKDSCVVIMKEQFVYVESDTVSVDGRIKMSLKIPDEVTFRGSFELQLPKGFGLTLEGSGYKTELADSYKESSGLNITARDDSTYLFEISPKTASASSKLRTASDKKEALNIYYTIYDNALENSTATYDARFVDIDFLFDNETEIKEKQLDIKIKVFKDPTGNEPVEEEKIIAYAKNHRLYVNTAKAETVYVYSSNGSLVFVKNKAEGLTMFELAAEDKILFVKGSSGWAQKVVTR